MRKKKTLFLWLVLIVLYLVSQQLVWKEQHYDYVNNYMFSYTTPRMRKFLAGGHDALVSNLSLIRGIQFYGMNYPLFDKKPTMYDQFHGLAEAAVQLDPRFTEAYLFWGFALTNAKRGKVDAYHFLMRGADALSATDEVIPPKPPRAAFRAVQPSLWRVAKDAGYVAQYELRNATPEWTVEAYEKALLSPDCPEFVGRLKTLAEASMNPDPMLPIREFVEAANTTTNEAIRELNLSHIRERILIEHKRFWDYAQQAYIEVHGASPTSIKQLTGDIRILKEAVERYREESRTWTVDGSAHLFPNLVDPFPGPTEKVVVKLAQPPELPKDPYGGEYLILQTYKGPKLVATGGTLQERKDYLASLNNAAVRYREKHDGACPDDLEAFAEEMGVRIVKADSFGYELLLDREKCEFYFPPISEDNPPTDYPWGVPPEEETFPDLSPIPRTAEENGETAAGAVSSEISDTTTTSPGE